jgi:hypothetical protein
VSAILVGQCRVKVGVGVLLVTKVSPDWVEVRWLSGPYAGSETDEDGHTCAPGWDAGPPEGFGGPKWLVVA